MQYASWENLEKLLEKSEAANKALEIKHTDLMLKWRVLRKRMGKNCPMARSVLKIIVMYEANNDKFIKSTEIGEWIE